MYYTYILYSQKSQNFYFGYTRNLQQRLEEHNQGLSKATKPYAPWKLIFYAAFDSVHMAKDFEKYLKTGSDKAFAYKRFLDTKVLKENMA